ncbi:unnamed protein product [Cuscuta europaea]|uniref:Uncharacterized protein n=1 Tax=Cuscuta europaea TaxID=41803 RepID=A0A9P1EHK8_CUSEU|nr:unnamed protein product [Cuscuta europaea]
MDRMSFMKRAQLKAAEELKAQQPGATAAAKPPVQPKKKRQAEEGQKKLTEVGMKPPKKSKRASSAGDAGTSAVPAGDGEGSNPDAMVDHPSGPVVHHSFHYSCSLNGRPEERVRPRAGQRDL